MAAWVLDIFSNFDFVQNYKIANYLTATEARDKKKCRFGILGIKKICKFDWGARKLSGENLKVVWAKFSTLS